MKTKFSNSLSSLKLGQGWGEFRPFALMDDLMSCYVKYKARRNEQATCRASVQCVVTREGEVECNKQYRPPRAAEFFLSIAADEELRGELLGDMSEKYAEKVEQHGVDSANLWYAFDVLRSVGYVVGDRLTKVITNCWRGLFVGHYS